jgi:hypothetical protein
MTTPQHATHGFIMGMLVSQNNWYVGIAGLVTGALPDLLGFFSKIKIKFNPLNVSFDSTDWKFYNKVHEIRWSNLWCYLPPYLLHLLIDKPWHRPQPIGGWYSWGIWAEILCWIFVTLPLLYYVFFIAH